MTLRIVRLGEKRIKNEGLRIGTVRRPPRGVPKADWPKRDFFDLWFPDLAPSEALLKSAPQAVADERTWKTFARRFEAELKRAEARRLLELFAALSHTTDFAIGCYCADESRCHRSILRAQLATRGARLV